MTSAGDELRKWRKAAGLSQAEVAANLGVSDGAVSQWEGGRTVPNRARAIRLDRLLKAEGVLAQALGYSLRDLEEDERVTALEAAVGVMQVEVSALRQELRRLVEGLPGQPEPPTS